LYFYASIYLPGTVRGNVKNKPVRDWLELVRGNLLFFDDFMGKICLWLWRLPPWDASALLQGNLSAVTQPRTTNNREDWINISGIDQTIYPSISFKRTHAIVLIFSISTVFLRLVCSLSFNSTILIKLDSRQHHHYDVFIIVMNCTDRPASYDFMHNTTNVQFLWLCIDRSDVCVLVCSNFRCAVYAIMIFLAWAKRKL
jgi:hypothetical protein